MAKNTDFIGFEFCNCHSSKYNLYVVSDGSRYQDELVPSPIDYAEQIPGGIGQNYFGSDIDIKEFPLNIAFDSVSEKDLRGLRKWLEPGTIGDLVFDERPYKTYTAKISSPPSISFICFDEYDEKEKKYKRVYKGEGTINFICYNPLAKVSGEKKELKWYREQIDNSYETKDNNSYIANYQLKENEIAVVDKIKGKTIEEGTGEKSPSNPFTLKGTTVSQIKMTGKNLINIANHNVSFVDNYYQENMTKFQLTAGQTYFLSYSFLIKDLRTNTLRCQVGWGVSPTLGMKTIINTAPFPIGLTGEMKINFTAPSEADGMYLVVRFARTDTAQTVSVDISNIQLEYNSFTEFEQYKEKLATISNVQPLNGIGDKKDYYSAYTGEETRYFNSQALNGSEIWGRHPNSDLNPNGIYTYYCELSGIYSDSSFPTEMPCLSTHYQTVNNIDITTIDKEGIVIYKTSANKRAIYIFSTLADVNSFKSFLSTQNSANKPVTVIYELNSPTVTKVNNIIYSSEIALLSDTGLITNSDSQYCNYFADSNSNITIRIYGSKYSNLDEWAESSGLLEDLSSPTQYNVFQAEEGRYGARLYNPGDKETNFILSFKKPVGELKEQKFWIETSNLGEESPGYSITISARATAETDSDKYGIASKEEIAVAEKEGTITIDTSKNLITFTSSAGTSSAYFLLKKGFFFKIPPTEDGMMYAQMDMSGSSLNQMELRLDYDYLYY